MAIKSCLKIIFVKILHNSETFLRRFRISKHSFLQIADNLQRHDVEVYGPQYLCRPTPEDRDRLMIENAERCFPGMVGFIDCMHWAWKNCLIALKGQYQDKEGKPTIVLEAIASQDGYIWHSFFGCPGSSTCLIDLLYWMTFYRHVSNTSEENVALTKPAMAGSVFYSCFYFLQFPKPFWE